MTDARENITFPILPMRVVKIHCFCIQKSYYVNVSWAKLPKQISNQLRFKCTRAIGTNQHCNMSILFQYQFSTLFIPKPNRFTYAHLKSSSFLPTTHNVNCHLLFTFIDLKVQTLIHEWKLYNQLFKTLIRNASPYVIMYFVIFTFYMQSQFCSR